MKRRGANNPPTIKGFIIRSGRGISRTSIPKTQSPINTKTPHDHFQTVPSVRLRLSLLLLKS